MIYYFKTKSGHNSIIMKIVYFRIKTGGGVKIMRLGGYSHFNGISFFCDMLKIKASRKKNKIEYKIDWILPNKWLRKLENKPILNSLLTIHYQWKIFDKKHRTFLAMLIAILVAEEVFAWPQEVFQIYLPFNSNYLYGFAFIVFLLSYKKIIRLFQYHGAEHKVINCYISHGYIDKYLVKQASRFNKRCGSNLAFILILFYFVLWFFNFESILWLFIIYLFSIQILKKIALSNKKWDKYINIFQWITVLEPRDEDIDLAIKAFQKLMTARRIYIRENNLKLN